MNRFSKDQSTVDDTLPRTFQMYFQTLLKVLATIGVIVYSTPAFIVIILPAAVLYYWIQTYYLASSRELKRLESVSKSPVVFYV